jgi:hypothetical protein
LRMVSRASGSFFWLMTFRAAG